MKMVCKICVLLWPLFFTFEMFAQSETEITNIYDYMNRLKKLKPGQTIGVDVIHDDEQIDLLVVL